MRVLPLIFAVLLAGGLVVVPVVAQAGCVEGGLCAELSFDKAEYKPGEEVTGLVVFNSRQPAMYPATIHTKIYKDGKLVEQRHTNVGRVYPGRTEFPLRSLGLGGLNKGRDPQGRWRVVLAKELSGDLTEAAFTVITDDPGPITLPLGFKIETYAFDVPNARSMAIAPGGTLFVGTRTEGKVYAVLDRNRDHRADEVLTVASGLDMPNGVAFFQNDLYVAEVSRILKFENIEGRLDDPPKPVIVNAAFPRDRSHGWKYIAFGPDGRLYVPVGAPCNVCAKDDERYASIMRMNPDGRQLKVYARGVRNTVGFAWHPVTQEMWFTDNGRDWMGDNRPPDELNLVEWSGQHFGFPHCHGIDVPDPEFGGQRGAMCDDFTPPVQELGPHVAALGMIFYTGRMFPAAYRNQILIAEHGSWNRSEPIGYRIMRVTLDGRKATSYNVFAEGWLQGEKVIGRPVDIVQLDDGSILVSDDHRGMIYRISYEPLK